MIAETIIKYIVTAVLGLVFGILVGFTRKLWLKVKALRRGTQSLLRADIIRAYEKYMEKGYCPLYARDALQEEYEAYHDLGGNGTITDLWNKLKSLPVEKEVSK